MYTSPGVNLEKYKKEFPAHNVFPDLRKMLGHVALFDLIYPGVTHTVFF